MRGEDVAPGPSRRIEQVADPLAELEEEVDANLHLPWRFRGEAERGRAKRRHESKAKRRDQKAMAEEAQKNSLLLVKTRFLEGFSEAVLSTRVLRLDCLQSL